MHKQFGDKGLAVVTVALDAYLDPKKDPATRQRVVDFLQSKGSSGFVNLYLEDPSVKWEEKFRFSEPPAYYVFSRQGKWTMFKADENGVNYDAMDKLIVELLKEK